MPPEGAAGVELTENTEGPSMPPEAAGAEQKRLLTPEAALESGSSGSNGGISSSSLSADVPWRSLS